MSKTKQEHIDEIMDWFDFGCVHKTMEALDWQWVSTGGLVPNVAEIRRAAREALSVAYDNSYEYYGTGGFVVRYLKEYDQMSLSFVVSDWTTNE